MKTTTIALLALSTIATAAPTATDSKPAADAYANVDWSKVKYPASAGANLPSYPAPAGGWANVAYPPGTGASASAPAACANGPFTFTSTYHILADPSQVVNGSNAFTGGLAGASGVYDLGVNSEHDYVCFSIALSGFRGEYQSPAKTATHMHQAARGKSGLPRLAFPNPVVVVDGGVRYSRGCLSAPYTTGVVINGTDTGASFSAKQIEANPSMFFVDVHSSLAVPGAIRGQVA